MFSFEDLPDEYTMAVQNSNLVTQARSIGAHPNHAKVENKLKIELITEGLSEECPLT